MDVSATELEILMLDSGLRRIDAGNAIQMRLPWVWDRLSNSETALRLSFTLGRRGTAALHIVCSCLSDSWASLRAGSGIRPACWPGGRRYRTGGLMCLPLCAFFLLPGKRWSYPSGGPETVSATRLESILLSSVRMTA